MLLITIFIASMRVKAGQDVGHLTTGSYFELIRALSAANKRKKVVEHYTNVIAHTGKELK